MKTIQELIKEVENSQVFVSDKEWFKLPTETKLEFIALSKMSGEDIQNNLPKSFRKLYDNICYDDEEYIEYCENCDEKINQVEIEGSFCCPICKREDSIILFDKKSFELNLDDEINLIKEPESMIKCKDEMFKGFVKLLEKYYHQSENQTEFLINFEHSIRELLDYEK